MDEKLKKSAHIISDQFMRSGFIYFHQSGKTVCYISEVYAVIYVRKTSRQIH